MNKKCIGIAFYKGTSLENPTSTWIDRSICRITNSRFSHVEVVVHSLGDKYLCFSSSHRDKGIRYKLIDIENGKWLFIKKDSLISVKDVYDLYEDVKGCRYDYIGLLSTILPWSKANIKRRFFCSEIVSTLLEYQNPCQYSPEKLYKRITKELSCQN